MKELLILTLPAAVFVYAVLATIALDRQYRRAEAYKKKLATIKQDYALADDATHNMTVTHIMRVSGRDIDKSQKNIKKPVDII